MTTTKWQSGINGNFDDPSKWTSAAVPATGDTALITATGTYTVSSDAANTIANLSMAKMAKLDVNDDFFSVTSGAAANTLAGTITVNDAASLVLGAASTNTTFNNSGVIDIQSGADQTRLRIAGMVTLAGKGKINLSGNENEANIVADGSAATLTNGSASSANTIAGVGIIGGPLLSFVNTARGVIDANMAGELSVMAATASNAGTMESTGGTLFLGTDVTQQATGRIKATASGSGIQLDGITIDGGTVSTAKGALIVPVSGTSEIKSSKAVVNDGDILTNGGNLIIDGSLSNARDSVFQVELGTSIKIGGTVTSGDAVFETGGGTIEFGGASSANVTFNADGTLVLDDPAKFTGTVAGMSTNSGASIDLENIKFADGSIVTFNRQHVLTVTDPVSGATDKIKIAGIGSFTTKAALDGSTLISDPPANAASAQNNGAQLLAQSMASFGAGGTVVTSGDGALMDRLEASNSLAASSDYGHR